MRIAAAGLIVAILGLGAMVQASPAAAQGDMPDNAAGAQTPPSEAVGAWTLESNGHAICRLTMSDQKLGSDFFGAQVPQDCDGVIPPGVAGWRPATDGLVFVDVEGRVLVDFNRRTPTRLTASSSGGPIDLKKAD